MNKEYMLLSIRNRIDILKQRIKDTISMKGYNKQSTAQFDRTKYKQELQLCMLLELLLLNCKTDTIDDEDAIKGFERLVNPMERHRRLKR